LPVADVLNRGSGCIWLDSATPPAKSQSENYNGGLGAEPPVWSRGKAPGQGVRGQSPPEADDILRIETHISEQILAVL